MVQRRGVFNKTQQLSISFHSSIIYIEYVGKHFSVIFNFSQFSGGKSSINVNKFGNFWETYFPWKKFNVLRH